MKTFEEAVTGKLFVAADSETINGMETWPIWEVLGVCAAPLNRPIWEGGRDAYAGDLVILRCLGDSRIDHRTAFDFRTEGYLFETVEAAGDYARRRHAEEAPVITADVPAFKEDDGE